MSQSHPIVLFDGVCNFCNASVNFIIRHDRRAVFRFAPLQSPAGERLLREHGADIGGLDTLVLIEGRQSCRKSAAALRIARRLPGPYPLFYGLIVLPPALRDVLYDCFARRRYRWFGKREQCMTPSPELRGRFLVD